MSAAAWYQATMNLLAMVLAGGEGTRLWPLTQERAKPAVPFGGRYRIIDFVLSNLVNSGFTKIKVLTQYRSDSLLKHLLRTWNRFAGFGGYIEPVPPQMNITRDWYIGSLDAIYQNLNILHDEAPDIVAVFGGDHIYKMDVRQMVNFHVEKKAAVTVAAVPVPKEEARRFGCISVDAEGRMTGFIEKPDDPPEMPDRPGCALASMGNYLFDSSILIREAENDAQNISSAHDFGRDLLPDIFNREPVYVYDFSTNIVPGEEDRVPGYWMDIGTIEAYYQASLDLVSVTPTLNMYNTRWPIRSQTTLAPPAKFVFADQVTKRIGIATDSLVCEGAIISGGHLEQSILSHDVRLNSYAHVSQSIIFDGVTIGRHARIRRAIIDKGVHIPEGTAIGYDLEEDRKHWFVSEDGIVVIPKGGPLSRRHQAQDQTNT
ncbi:MAG: glucose-1-phosphate adenylyltransferase [Myxococcota bacterium]